MIRNIAIVSLSSGLLGEDFVRHEVALGLERLEELGVNVRFMPHARMGLQYVRDHPEHRAADLLEALAAPDIDMILCAIGGDDTYRLLPHLFDHGELAKAASGKIFLGFSDTTVNHFMFHKVGLNTFYGQAFLPDVCELDSQMLPYTRRYFEELLRTGAIREITPSGAWYESRVSFGPDQLGVPLKAHPDGGFRLLQGPARFSGPIMGGCLDSMYEMLFPARHQDMPGLCRRYGLFPSLEDWKGKILLLETSEEKMPPERFRKALETLKDQGLFRVISGILLGKPMDEAFEEDYWRILPEVVEDPSLPILANVGHAQPRCIIPLGVGATVDAQAQVIRFQA